MSNNVPDIRSEVDKVVKELTRIYSRVLPVKVGKEVVSSINRNFREGGFYGSQWKKTKRQEVPFKGTAGSNGPLLSKQDHLMSNTRSIPGPGRVIIQNNTPYASYHNEGARNRVTRKMKKFFWAKYFETTGIKKDDSKENKRRKRMNASPEANFWKGMALKKVGKTIILPKRQFLGPSPQVDAIVTDIINKELEKFIQKFK